MSKGGTPLTTDEPRAGGRHPRLPGLPRPDGDGVAIYHRMKSREDFAETARILALLVKKAIREHPGQPRHLFLDIDGHRNDAGGYDHDAFELMAHFIPNILGPHLTRIPNLPEAGTWFENPNQNDDLPDLLMIQPEPAEGEPPRERPEVWTRSYEDLGPQPEGTIIINLLEEGEVRRV